MGESLPSASGCESKQVKSDECTAQHARPLRGPLATDNAKILLHDPITAVVAEALSAALTRTFPSVSKEAIAVSTIANSLVAPPNPLLGDLCYGCFNIAKEQRQSPADAAKSLVKALTGESNAEFTAVGPYVNVKIKLSLFLEHALEPVLSEEYFKRAFCIAPPKTMVEFSQPNTHKEMHVGHMRNICLGDALSKCSKYIGIPIVTGTFPGDVGTHVAKCLWYMKHRCTEAAPTHDRGTWLGNLYSRANAQLEAESAAPKDTENQSVISEILRQIEGKSGEYFKIWAETRLWSIELMEEAYRWANVSFDRWYWESEVDSDSVAFVRDLHSRGVVIESDGALGVDLSSKKLGFCLLLKSDGNGLYATKDLMLAHRKFEDFKLDKSLYVVDLRQTFHFQQVFSALEIIGFSHASDCYHLPYNFVELPDGAMSSRKGNIIPLRRLIDEMERTIRERYLARYEGDWPAEEISETARLIANSAIKFGMNQVEPGTKIVFDIEQWLRLDGNSGPYVQYACARIRSLLRKAGDVAMSSQFDSLLIHQLERQLLVKLTAFNGIVLRIVETMKTNLLCEFLLDLAKTFAAYYAEVKVIDPSAPELTKARIRLCSATQKVLEKGLGLVGIGVPERM